MPFVQWNLDDPLPLDPSERGNAVCVLPLGATEQHGPHLPASTDNDIARGLMVETEKRLSAPITVVAVPVQAVGASQEHERYEVTVSIATPELMNRISAVARKAADAGMRRLVLISSHGGNTAAMTAAALVARAKLNMLAVATSWMRLGLPEGLVSDRERRIGIHGGLIETSLMLHLHPERVNMRQAAQFSSLQAMLEERYALLRAYGPVGFGWLAGDLNPAGVVGEADGASAEIGAAIAAYQAERFALLLAEVVDFDPDIFLSG